MRIILIGILFALMCAACGEAPDHRGKTLLAEVGDKYLYVEDLNAVFPLGLSGKDSLQFVESYVRNWAEDVLLYEKAESNIPGDALIEEKVANFRKALIVHTYQQALIQQQLSDELSEEELTNYYEQHQTLFKLESPLVQGLFIKVPLTAPRLNNVRRWYKSVEQEAIDNLEKYSLQHAVQYEYFYDKWISAADVLKFMPPVVSASPENYLRKKHSSELKDSAFYYFLNVTDYRGAGEQTPYAFARPQVRDMLLNAKQVNFMQDVKEELYKQAVERNKIKIYHK